MPYQNHPDIYTPHDTSKKIWRYLDFTKFLSLIEDKALFFSQLTDQEDKTEGFLTKASVDRFRNFSSELKGYDLYRQKNSRTNSLMTLKKMREDLYISSWHMSDHESSAMWEIYLNHSQGIAIQTTIKRFIDALNESKEDVYISKINYLDREKDEFPWNNAFFLALNKDNSYEHEKEIRAIILNHGPEPGLSVPVDLKKLIETIILAPYTPKWIQELIQKILFKNNINTIVKPSALNQNSLY